MRSPDRTSDGPVAKWRALFVKEFREILAGRAFWIMLFLLSLLMGYSFVQAVNLYREASRTALQFPQLARGMSPLDGILVPTWGAFYLAMTLLFPFIAIRLIGNEKQSGSLKLLLQLAPSPRAIVLVKTLALAASWGVMLIPACSSLLLWAAMGGHLYLPETFNLVLGHALYALVIACIAFLAAALTESTATAAIVALAFILGSWVLDFASGSQGGWLKHLSFLSLTASLRAFEHGLFDLVQALRLCIAAASLLGLTMIWLPPGTPLIRKLSHTIAVAALASAMAFLSGLLIFYSDVTEDRRNSFNPSDELALKAMNLPLRITIHMNPEDSRLKEMERNVLAKLRRAVPKVKITYVYSGESGSFGSGDDPNYGLIVYAYAGKRDKSTSNSDEEILSILHNLAGQQVTAVPEPEYKGYPLVADTILSEIWYYGVLPCFLALAWWLTRHAPRGTGQRSTGGSNESQI